MGFLPSTVGLIDENMEISQVRLPPFLDMSNITGPEYATLRGAVRAVPPPEMRTNHGNTERESTSPNPGATEPDRGDEFDRGDEGDRGDELNLQHQKARFVSFEDRFFSEKKCRKSGRCWRENWAVQCNKKRWPQAPASLRHLLLPKKRPLAKTPASFVCPSTKGFIH